VLSINYMLPARLTHATINGHHYVLENAVSTVQQAQGLGGRVSMPSNYGMLFTFTHPSMVCLWMKDMHFPLDMVWFNDHKQVIHEVTNVSPLTYPRVFCPPQPAHYVIELQAGQIASTKLREGQTVQF